MPDPLALLSRRRLLQIGGGGYLGLNLGGLCRARAAGPPTTIAKPIRACILFFQYGGPSHLDTYDLKPDTPAEVRGEFKSIATSAPSVRVCEHLPHMAKVMHKVAVVRSVTHAGRLHDSAAIHALTGRPLDGPDRELFAPLPQVFPSYGSAIAYLHRGRPAEVPFACLPFVFRNVHDVPCQGGGMLGAAYDPLHIESDLTTRTYRVPAIQPAADLPHHRGLDRRDLLRAIEARGSRADSRTQAYETAYHLLESVSLRTAIDMSAEPMAVRDRYGLGPSDDTAAGPTGGGENGIGRNLRGQNLLIARRLVEAGVPFVNVNDFRQQGQNWDAHAQGFVQHKTHLLPAADRGLSALIEDLDDRGLLDSTLIVAMGEFGRTPKVNGSAGRDHWPDCYSVLFAGGGVRGGAVYGASDRFGAYPAADPVTPGDLAATIFWRFGLDPATEIHDPTGRPHRLAAGEPLYRLFT